MKKQKVAEVAEVSIAAKEASFKMGKIHIPKKEFPAEESKESVEVMMLRKELERMKLDNKKKEKKFRLNQVHVQTRAQRSGAALGAAAAGSFFAPSKRDLSTEHSSGNNTPRAEQERNVRMADD